MYINAKRNSVARITSRHACPVLRFSYYPGNRPFGPKNRDASQHAAIRRTQATCAHLTVHSHCHVLAVLRIRRASTIDRLRPGAGHRERGEQMSPRPRPRRWLRYLPAVLCDRGPRNIHHARAAIPHGDIIMIFIIRLRLTHGPATDIDSSLSEQVPGGPCQRLAMHCRASHTLISARL